MASGPSLEPLLRYVEGQLRAFPELPNSLRRVETVWMHHDMSLGIHFNMGGGSQDLALRFDIRWLDEYGFRRVSDLPRDFTDHLTQLYWRVYEDKQVERQLHSLREAIVQAHRVMATPHVIQMLRERYQAEEANIRRHHGRVVSRMDLGTIDETSVLRITPNGVVNVRGPEMTATEVEVRRREAEAHWVRSVGNQRWATEYLTRMSEEVLRNYEHGSTIFGGITRSNPEADKRARELLVSKLDEQQRKDYADHQWFDVIGGQTGKRYRIREGRQMNIDQLDRRGFKHCGWCFLPVGGLANGDVMLAQKLWLESDRELEALKIANRF